MSTEGRRLAHRFAALLERAERCRDVDHVLRVEQAAARLLDVLQLLESTSAKAERRRRELMSRDARNAYRRRCGM